MMEKHVIEKMLSYAGFIDGDGMFFTGMEEYITKYLKQFSQFSLL